MRFFRIRAKRFGWRKCLVVLATMPVVLWVSLNLFFLTSFGRGLIEDEILERFQIETEIDHLSWSPWAGVTMEGLKICPPGDCGQKKNLVEVDEVSVDLSWSSLLSGRKRWERLEVKGVRVEISLEALKVILSRFEKPASKAVKPREREGQLAGTTDGVPPEKAPGNEETGSGRETTEKPNQPATKKASEVDDFEGVVAFSGVSLRVFSLKAPDLDFTLSGVEGEIPVWGGERSGELTLGKVSIGGRLSEKTLNLPVIWRNREVSLETGEMKLFGLNLKLAAVVKMARGYPMGIRIDLPSQQLDLSPLFQDQDTPLSVDGFTSTNVIQGYLGAPGSFGGRSVSTFDQLTFHDLLDGGETRFNQGQAVIGLSAAGLTMLQARAVGEEDAVLMNGFATFSGVAAATVRIVSSPERALSHQSRVDRAGGELVLDFEPLVTPDRVYRDVRMEWRQGQLMIDLARDHGWVSLAGAARRVLGRKSTEPPFFK